MGALKAIAIAVALFGSAPSRAESVAGWRAYVMEASARFGVPVAWIERVMHAESAGRAKLDERPITSRAGAMGLMQLMSATWAEMRAAHTLGDDPHDNIIAGTAIYGRCTTGSAIPACSPPTMPVRAAIPLI